MLEALSQVQALDLELDGLEVEQARTPQELLDIRARRTELANVLGQRQRDHDDLQRRVRANELDLAALEARRRASSESSLRATSVKEASQFQNQEIQFATRVQELEEETFPLMESLETLADEVSGLEDLLAEIDPTMKKLESVEKKRVARTRGKITSLSRSRNHLAETIERPLLRQYEQVRKSRRGVGLVEILHRERCGGCNVKLPIHVIQKSQRDGSVTRCPSCGRILWNKPNGKS